MRLFVAVAAVALLSLRLSAPAQANLLIANFGGTVDDGSYTDSGPGNTGFQVGQTITGSFVFNTATSTFTTRWSAQATPR